MKSLIIILALSLSSFQAFSQEKDSIIIVHEYVPSFPGGLNSLNKFILKNLKYPRKLCVEGAVYVQFIVNEDGLLSDAKVVKGICEPCDKNALDVVAKMPNWEPGKLNGKPIKMKTVIPIRFKL